MPAPKKGPRIGGSPDAPAPHARRTSPRSLFEAEGITTTVSRAKALRPYAEKLITKAKKGGVHQQRQVVSTIHDTGRGAQAVRRDRARATRTATAATCGS